MAAQDFEAKLLDMEKHSDINSLLFGAGASTYIYCMPLFYGYTESKHCAVAEKP